MRRQKQRIMEQKLRTFITYHTEPNREYFPWSGSANGLHIFLSLLIHILIRSYFRRKHFLFPFSYERRKKNFGWNYIMERKVFSVSVSMCPERGRKNVYKKRSWTEASNQQQLSHRNGRHVMMMFSIYSQTLILQNMINIKTFRFLMRININSSLQRAFRSE